MRTCSRTLLAAYFAEHHAEGQLVLDVLTPRLVGMDPAEYMALFKTFNEALITRRNHAWMPIILEAVDGADGPVVAAFGAAHLSGQDGILNLLTQEGFTVERAAF